jgi:hypothetical protein
MPGNPTPKGGKLRLVLQPTSRSSYGLAESSTGFGEILWINQIVHGISYDRSWEISGLPIFYAIEKSLNFNRLIWMNSYFIA